MKKLNLHFVTFFPLLILFHQGIGQAPSPQWIARYNGPGNNSDEVRAMTIDGSGNVYVTGPSAGDRRGNVDYATVKYNSAGVQQWVARYNGRGNGEDYPYAIAVDGNGNVYVTGRSMGSKSALDIATVKYNSLGVFQWDAIYNGPANINDVPGDVKVDASGNVFVTGYADASYVIGGAPAIITIKYNNTGQQQWLGRYDHLPNDGTGTNNEQGVSLALDASGYVYVTGQSGGMVTIKYDPTDPSGQPLWSTVNGTDSGRKILIDGQNNVIVSGFCSKIVKHDSNGNLVWETNASNASAAFWDMALDGTGNIYVTGQCNDSYSSSDYVTAKYDAAGTEQWLFSFGGSLHSTDFARSIALDSFENVYVTGRCSVANGTRNGGVNYGTVKYNKDGAQQWVALYDTPDKITSDAFRVVTDAYGNVYVSGQSATKASSYDFATLKYPAPPLITRKSIIAELDEGRPNFSLQNYPNPFNEFTTIEYQLSHDENVRLSVYDGHGKEVAILVNTTQAAGAYKVKFDANGLPAGAYFCRMHSAGISETKKLIVVK